MSSARVRSFRLTLLMLLLATCLLLTYGHTVAESDSSRAAVAVAETDRELDASISSSSSSEGADERESDSLSEREDAEDAEDAEMEDAAVRVRAAEPPCLGFRATAGRTPNGARTPKKDATCATSIAGKQAGYCLCADGVRAGRTGAGHKGFTCAAVCAAAVKKQRKSAIAPPTLKTVPFCIGWRSTGSSCKAGAVRQTAGDLTCYQKVPRRSSGYCLCAGGVRAAASTCHHKSFICARECFKVAHRAEVKQRRESALHARRRREAARKASLDRLAAEADALAKLAHDDEVLDGGHPLPLPLPTAAKRDASVAGLDRRAKADEHAADADMKKAEEDALALAQSAGISHAVAAAYVNRARDKMRAAEDELGALVKKAEAAAKK